MKTLSVLFLALILIFSGCSKSDDLPVQKIPEKQLKSQDTKTIHEYILPIAPDAYFPLECDGELVDWLEPYDGSIVGHLQLHTKDGKWVWMKIHVKGTAKSINTGEIFTINEINKMSFDEDEVLDGFTVKTHARGDQGKNIIIFTTIKDFYNFEFVITKANCVNL